MRKRTAVNPKRRLQAPEISLSEMESLADLASRASYGGNPEHKRNPGDFGLTPPSSPREGKTLCDDAEIFKRAEARALLKEGLRRGLVSVQKRNGWPQNVWAVSENGTALEAQLENAATGQYHGYPMLYDDPLRLEVIARWKSI